MKFIGPIVAIGAAAVLAGCGGSGSASPQSSSQGQGASPVSGRQAMVAWYTGGAKPRLTRVESDLNAVSTAGNDHDVTGLRVACNSLRVDTESLQNYTEAPDHRFRSLLDHGLVLYARSAADCLSGLSPLDAATIQRSGSELRAGTRYINSATARLAAL